MKKKFISVMALLLVGAMLSVSLTGCGTEARATGQDLPSMDEETIIVTNDETTGDDIIVTDNEVQEEVQNTQDSPFVFFEEYIGNFPDEPFDEYELENCDEEVTVDWEVPIDIGGKEVGYIKAGETVHLIKTNEYGTVYRVENNTNYGFKYIYASRDNLLTLEDMKNQIMDYFEGMEVLFLDNPDSDMKYIEFSVERSLSSGSQDIIWENLKTIGLSEHDTFCVVCTISEEISEWTDRVPRYLVDCKVYYK